MAAILGSKTYRKVIRNNTETVSQKGHDERVVKTEELKVNGKKEVAQKLPAREQGDLLRNAECRCSHDLQRDIKTEIRTCTNSC